MAMGLPRGQLRLHQSMSMERIKALVHHEGYVQRQIPVKGEFFKPIIEPNGISLETKLNLINS